MTDRIVSHPSTQEYRDNYDRIFGKNEDETIGPMQAMIREATACLRSRQSGAHSELRLSDQATVRHAQGGAGQKSSVSTLETDR